MNHYLNENNCRPTNIFEVKGLKHYRCELFSAVVHDNSSAVLLLRLDELKGEEVSVARIFPGCIMNAHDQLLRNKISIQAITPFCALARGGRDIKTSGTNMICHNCTALVTRGFKKTRLTSNVWFQEGQVQQ